MDTRVHAIDDSAVHLVVGVTSHRDLVAQDVPALREQVRETLSSLRATFPDLALTIVSPLAEGGDQLVAEVGLELGARLIVPLPLPVELYRDDFSSERVAGPIRTTHGPGAGGPVAVPGRWPRSRRTGEGSSIPHGRVCTSPTIAMCCARCGTAAMKAGWAGRRISCAITSAARCRVRAAPATTCGRCCPATTTAWCATSRSGAIPAMGRRLENRAG